MRNLTVTGILLAGALALAGCGESPGCRAVTGGALGAAGGAALGAIGGNPALGAVAGGAAGATTGALTSPGQVSAGPSPVCN
jgi:osmotically inducible lipoprotein OsmB